MDPISIITLCASATATAYHVSATLYSFINSAKNIDSEIESLAREIGGVRRVLDAMGVVFTNPIIKSDKAVSIENGPIWAAVAGALNDCRISVERFDAQLSNSNRHSTGRNFFKQSIKWMKLSYKLEDIGKARFQMSTHANNLQIALQMVTILVTTIGPSQTSVDQVGEDYDKLQQSMSQLSLVEEKLPSEDRAELQKRTEYLKRTANAVLLSLDRTPNIVLDKQDQQSSRERLHKIVAEFNNSLYDGEYLDDPPSDAPPEYETISDSDPTVGLDLALIHLGQGNSYFNAKQYRLAETVIREGLQHWRGLDQGTDDFDVMRYQLLLIRSCMWQDKWQEAELMLMALAKSNPSQKIDSYLLEAYHLLAQTHLCQYDFHSALEYCKMAVAGRKRLYGRTSQAYVSSVQLLALIHYANGDSISSLAYENTVAEASAKEPENDIVSSRFSGYSNAEHVRTTLLEKGMAIRELIKKGFLSAPQTLSSNGTAWSENMPTPITFHPANVDVDLTKALVWTAETGMEYVLRWLISRGAYPNTSNRGYPAIVTAASCAHTTLVRTLILAGADINTPDNNGRTALLWASLNGHNETARVLLEHGADINKADQSGYTPLIDATIKGHDSTVRLLLQNNARLEATSDKGSTALGYAASESQIECSRALIRHGADVNASDKSGETPLILAAEQRDRDTCFILLEAGADVNARSKKGWTALRKLAIYANTVDLQRLMLDRGADVDACPDDDAATALLASTEAGNVANIQLLLERGADPGQRRYGKNAMQIARDRGYKGAIKVLSKFKAPEG